MFSPIPLVDFAGMIRDAVRHEMANHAAVIPPPVAPTELITRREAAHLLGVSLPTLHLWSKSGQIPAYRINTRVRYKKAELETALQLMNSPLKKGR